MDGHIIDERIYESLLHSTAYCIFMYMKAVHRSVYSVRTVLIYDGMCLDDMELERQNWSDVWIDILGRSKGLGASYNEIQAAEPTDG